MKKALIIIALIIGARQYAQELPDIIPPSPEAASLGKFTEVPVSLYTGLANVSVPITSFEVGGKSFPVSLNYHARGVKVSEIASRVGIGWALNAGGAISRQTRHVADDGPLGYLDSGNSLITKLASEQWFNSNPARISFLGQDPGTEKNTDRIPDAYSLQASAISAKFIMDYKPAIGMNYNDPHDVILQKYDDLEVSYSLDSSGRIESFIAIDAQGFTYYFGKSKDGQRLAQNWDETLASYNFPMVGSYSDTSPNSFFKTYNTWHLMDIESPHGEVASFSYGVENSEYFSRSYDKVENSGPVNYSSKIWSHQYQLREIVHSGGKIVFEEFQADDREDFAGSHALDKISIYDQELNFVKSFELNQSYQTAISNGNQNSQLSNLEILTGEPSKRLFLDAVVEQGKNGVSKPPYVLSYYKKDQLPHRYSNSQDYWGYYNGADNGQFLTFSNDGSLFSSNRRVDVDKSMAGMLLTITYPTGGSTRFTYEHNKGKLGLEHQNVFLPAINPINTLGNHTAFLGHLMYIDSTNYGPYAGYQGDVYSKTFTIDNFVNSSFNYSVWFQNDTGCSETVITGDCRFRVYLNGNGNSYNLLKGSHTINNISSGTYTLIVDPVQAEHDPINNTDDHFTAGVTWEEVVNETTQIYASGKRIKKINFYDSDGSLESFKEYKYGTGRILGISSFRSLQNTPNGPFFILEPLGAVPGSPLSTYQGNSIGYPSVTEYQGNSDFNIGKTVYSYTLLEDTGDYATFPYHPPTDNEWLRGLPLSVQNYRKESGDNYSLVKKIEYEYLYGNFFIGNNDPSEIPLNFTPQSIRLDFDQDMTYGTQLSEQGLPYEKSNTLFRLPLIHLYYPPEDLAANGTNAKLDYKVYYFTGGTMSPFSTQETFYYDNGSTTINYSENSYDYANHHQVASTLSQASDDKAMITAYTYPQSISSTPGSVIESLQDQNRHVPLEVRTYKDEDEDGVADTNEALSYLKTTYAWADGILAPSLVQASKALDENSLEDVILYHSYNALGKPLEVSKANGPKISYIWGYDQQYPIAKIENASYVDIAAALGISVSTLKNYNESNLSQINGLRNSLSTAMVSTFTYEPMVGVTEMTDPKGYTMTYLYDDLNRLKEVRDHNNKLVAENMYHYKNQQ